MTSDHWYDICYKTMINDIIIIKQIKYNIVIICQYTIAKIYVFCSIAQNIIKSILITYHLGFHCKIIINPLCIVCFHLMGLIITGRFSKWGHQSKYIVRHVKWYDNHSHWLDTVVNWRSLPGGSRFTTVLRSIPPKFSIPCDQSTIKYSLLICNGNCVFSNAGVDQNWK